MPVRRVSPMMASSSPPIRSRGSAATLRPPISNDCVSGAARAAATKAGAASSADDSKVQSPMSEMRRPPSRGLVISITIRSPGASSSIISPTRKATTSSSPSTTAARARSTPAARSSASHSRSHHQAPERLDVGDRAALAFTVRDHHQLLTHRTSSSTSRTVVVSAPTTTTCCWSGICAAPGSAMADIVRG
jgi:hypothetical protein